jgi:hypothetical protein
MTTYTLSRTGDAPVSFEGDLLAEAGGHWLAGRELNRWHSLAIYDIANGFVLSISYHTRWQGETDCDLVFVCNTPTEVKQKIREYNPVPVGIGYPPADQYRERQSRLETDLRRQYAAAVTELLAGRPEFADRI